MRNGNLSFCSYDRWLKRAKKEDLSQIAHLRCLYQSGFDKYNRPVVVFVAKYFPANSINLEKVSALNT